MAQSWSMIEDEDDNMLVKLDDAGKEQAFLNELQHSTAQIREIVSYHLGLGQREKLEIARPKEWLRGSFNVCIPITVGNAKQRVILRCPFPFMLGSMNDASITAEKLRCEAATYVWISSNCQSVPIPHLWGFGLPDGLRFTPIAHVSWFTRFIERCKDIWASFSYQHRQVPFISRQFDLTLRSGYLLTDFVEHGTILDRVWPPPSSQHRHNLYVSLAKIMLSMSRHSLQVIGSFTIHNTGEMSLTNRPLTHHLPLLERQGIPTLPKERVYHRTDMYVHDLLDVLESKLEYQPNAIRDESDAHAQMATFLTLRAVQKHFALTEFQSGPFVMILTDLHKSNIFVDTEFRITSIIDLEWCCSLPSETQHPPFWLTGRDVDDFEQEEHTHALYAEWNKFIDVLKHEDVTSERTLSKTMQQCIAHSIHWYVACLTIPRATYNLFLDHIQPIFAREHSDGQLSVSFQQIIAKYWRPQSEKFIRQKLQDRERYIQELRTKYQSDTVVRRILPLP